jgi:NADPH2:quinone reductase
MKAALCKSLDGPGAIVVEDIPEPSPGAGEVVVRVKAAALNFLDTLIVRGKYQFKPALPFSPAGEFAGVIDALGEGVTGLAIGDRVMGYVSHGAAREKLAVAAKAVSRVAPNVSDAVAAGLTVTYGTGLYGLKDRGGVQPGETVAVLGAAGGAGLAAVEIAKLLGARVIAVASSEEKLAVCRKAGADAVFNYTTGDLKQGLRELSEGRGVDVVYDCVGGPHTEAALRATAWGGRVLVIGFAAGEIPKIPINLLLLKSASLVGVLWGDHTRREPERHAGNMRQLMDWVAAGRIIPHVHKSFPLEETAAAVRELDERRATGKVIIRI